MGAEGDPAPPSPDAAGSCCRVALSLIREGNFCPVLEVRGAEVLGLASFCTACLLPAIACCCALLGLRLPSCKRHKQNKYCFQQLPRNTVCVAGDARWLRAPAAALWQHSHPQQQLLTINTPLSPAEPYNKQGAGVRCLCNHDHLTCEVARTDPTVIPTAALQGKPQLLNMDICVAVGHCPAVFRSCISQSVT